MAGLFFEKRSKAADGRFFRDLPGRAEASFHKAADDLVESLNAGNDEMGTGDGKPAAAKKIDKLVEYEKKEHGHIPTPKEEAAEKKANPDPTYLFDEPVANGFHRPARDQPEALEHGGERFHASEADYGTGRGFMHGVIGGQQKTPARASSQMGKQADFAEKAKSMGSAALDKAKQYGGQAVNTLGQSGSSLGEAADHAMNDATQSPLGAAALVGGAGVLGAKAVGGAARGVGRGVARLAGRKPQKTMGLVERALAGLKHLHK